MTELLERLEARMEAYTDSAQKHENAASKQETDSGYRMYKMLSFTFTGLAKATEAEIAALKAMEAEG